MPEFTNGGELIPNPHVSEEDDRANAGRLKSDVAHQVYNDIRKEAKREKIVDDASLKKIFNERSESTLPDYQAVQIVDFEKKATRDKLTGLLNRRGFNELFEESLQQSEKSGQPILFLMMDLDHFKKINDSFGHLIGDEVLKYLSRALLESVEIGDLVCRWGGEEIVVVIKPKPGRNVSQDRLLMATERIRRQIIDLLSKDVYRQRVNDQEKEISVPVTLSVGATLSRPNDTAEKIYQRADDNLYKAKNGGRNQSFGDTEKIILAPHLGVLPEMPSS